MPYSGAGVFTLVTPINPYITGAVISAPDMNTTLSDIATNGLTNAVTRDGQSPLTGNWPVGGFNITGIGTLTCTTLTVSGSLTFGSTLTVSAGGIVVTGNSTITGTLGVVGATTITGALGVSTTVTAGTGLTVTTGGATITGNSTITGTLGGLTGLTMASGLITASSSGVRFSDATTQTTAAVSKVAQVALTTFNSQGTVTDTTLPLDNTIPTISEGVQLFAASAFTPTNASSTIYIEVVVNFSSTGLGSGQTNSIAIQLNQAAVTNALAATLGTFSASPTTSIWTDQLSLTISVAAGSTASRVYSVRTGRDGGGAGTISYNDDSPRFGGVMFSTLKITEVLP